MQHQTINFSDRFCPFCHTERDEVAYTPPILAGLPAIAEARCINPLCEHSRPYYVNVSPELPEKEQVNA